LSVAGGAVPAAFAAAYRDVRDCLTNGTFLSQAAGDREETNDTSPENELSVG